MRNNAARYWVDQATCLVAFHFRRRRLDPKHCIAARRAISAARQRAAHDHVAGYRLGV